MSALIAENNNGDLADVDLLISLAGALTLLMALQKFPGDGPSRNREPSCSTGRLSKPSLPGIAIQA
jgi:hypothetical protein